MTMQPQMVAKIVPLHGAARQTHAKIETKGAACRTG